MNDERAITVVEAPVAGPITTQSGTLALAMLSDAEFDARLAALKRGQERVQRVQRELMKPEVDYGIIPGTGNKPTLLKPGAEKLCNLYGLIPEFKHERFVGDGETAPVLQFITTCYLHAGHDGPVAGMGVGEANSWEKKHRYRTAERACPKCGNLGTVRHSKDRDGWYCWAKIGGCGATFPENTPEIKDQQLGQVENPDPYDLANTLVKMSSKRCLGGSTPLLFRTDLGVTRGTVELLYQIYCDGNRTLQVPGPRGEWRNVEAMVRNESGPMYRINLADGSHIRATAEHRFPTKEGLKSVAELIAGDSLLRWVIALDGPIASAEWSFGFAAGLFIAEGNFDSTYTRYTLNGKRQDLVDQVRYVAHKLGSPYSVTQKDENCVRISISGPAFSGLMRQFVDGEKAQGKHFSRYTWRQGPAFIGRVLDGYLNGDGSWQESQGRQGFWQLTFTGENYELADDIRAACAVLDYRVSLKRSDARYKDAPYPVFTGWVKMVDPKYNARDLECVVSVEREPRPAPSYDIQVDDDHTFLLANGIQTHNSYVDAALRTTATSGLFTQDLEDMADSAPPARPATPQPQTSRPAPQTPPPTPAPATSGLAAADDWTTFWTTTKKLGYADAKAVNAALGVNNINDWINHGGTQASAIDILTKLAG